MIQKLLRGCLMCDSLYIKANGEMPCWDDVGESRVLRRLNFAELSAGVERELFSHSSLIQLRRSFMDGKMPHRGLCERCAVRSHGPSAVSPDPQSMRILHVEPSYLCHLSC